MAPWPCRTNDGRRPTDASFRMRILVTDGDSRAALAVTRALGPLGHEVWVGAPREPSLAHTSRHCARRITYPDPVRDPAA